MRTRSLIAAVSASLLFTVSVSAQEPPPYRPKNVPRLQAVPLPYDQVSFQRDGMEITRLQFGPDLRRPFLFPVIGPTGRSLTRMGHPHDPESHSHHNSVWISHNDVNGVSFWDDRAKGRIVHRRVKELTDSDVEASVTTESDWVADSRVMLSETRKTSVRMLGYREWLMIIEIRLAAKEPVTLGKTPFGLLGVRMAKTIGVHDGGGMIRNSGGGVNEEQVLWKRAKWVDYSGAITNEQTEGITLMDHPANPNHPAYFHVRNDGWMGVSLTYDAPRAISPDQPLLLRYGLYVHAGMLATSKIETVFRQFAGYRSTIAMAGSPPSSAQTPQEVLAGLSPSSTTEPSIRSAGW